MRSGFLALAESVKDHPDDDAPRLALAQWLEENGRDDAERMRGEFIRLQCRLARLGSDDPSGPILKAQGMSLRNAHQVSWLGDWGKWMVRPDTEQTWFQRGLLRPWVKGLRWLDEGPQEAESWALVDGLEVLDLRLNDVTRLAASPILDRLNLLHLGPDSWTGNAEIGDEGARALASSPYLRRIRSLELSDTAIESAGIAALVAAPELRHLTSLSLMGFDCTTGNCIGDVGARAIAESSHMSHLTRLWLPNNNITDEGVRELAGSANLNELTDLMLIGNPIGPDGARALASSPYLGRLTKLYLEVPCPWPTAYRRLTKEPRDVEDAKEALRLRFGAAWV
jgi:uncharacterized protein (TIGR02996 family)